jgi:hypothetical protein
MDKHQGKKNGVLVDLMQQQQKKNIYTDRYFFKKKKKNTKVYLLEFSMIPDGATCFFWFLTSIKAI